MLNDPCNLDLADSIIHLLRFSKCLFDTSMSKLAVYVSDNMKNFIIKRCISDLKAVLGFAIDGILLKLEICKAACSERKEIVLLFQRPCYWRCCRILKNPRKALYNH